MTDIDGTPGKSRIFERNGKSLKPQVPGQAEKLEEAPFIQGNLTEDEITARNETGQDYAFLWWLAAKLAFSKWINQNG